ARGRGAAPRASGGARGFGRRPARPRVGRERRRVRRAEAGAERRRRRARPALPRPARALQAPAHRPFRRRAAEEQRRKDPEERAPRAPGEEDMKRLLLLVLCAAGAAAADEGGFCLPDKPCWPSAAEWQKLRAAVGGRLGQPEPPLPHLSVELKRAGCATEIQNLKNPFFIQDQPGGTESLGWLGAWNAAPSAYAVAADSPADVAAAVNFAREHGLRLVVKGTGHDYLGRSNAPGSLLIWTHAMRQIQSHDAFVPKGCTRAGIPAVSLGAGTRWLQAYQDVTIKHGRYVQGGGCTSVGAAGGFLQ